MENQVTAVLKFLPNQEGIYETVYKGKKTKSENGLVFSHEFVKGDTIQEVLEAFKGTQNIVFVSLYLSWVDLGRVSKAIEENLNKVK